MSRIIVKNLPKTVTEDKVRKIFGQSGLLTDVQLKYTPDGKFRQFAFLGYQNEDEAKQVIAHFNNTCIQTNKVTVELCATLGDTNKPKAWSKYAKDSSAFKKLNPVKKEEETPKEDENVVVKVDNKVELLKKYKDDPLFEEFLQVHNSKEVELLRKLKTTHDDESENDDEAADSGVSDEGTGEDEAEKIADMDVSDKEYMNILMNKEKPPKREKKPKEKKDIKLFNLKLKNLPVNCKKKDIKQFFSPNVPFSIRIPRHIKGIAFVGYKTEKQFKKGLMKDKSILAGKSVLVSKCGSDHSDNSEGQDPKKLKWMSQEEKLKNEEDIGESGRIFIRNLAYITVEDDIQTLFSKYGPLTEVNLPIDPVSRKPKGFGVVTFLMPEHAVKAYSELDGTVLRGRMLHLLPGIAKDTHEDENEESSNYKKDKAKKEKAQANSTHNWNSLFLGHDAVAEVIANTYGTSKRAVLDPHGSSNPAVRLALGETQIVAATRKYLEEEGVVLDAFAGTVVKRSKTIILVKNLPANTDIKELRNLFEPHGIIGRIILPPSGVSGIVEFIEPSEARKAFTRLAYSKFKNLPLYLEWAPENSLNKKTISTNIKKDDRAFDQKETKIGLGASDTKTESTNEEEDEEVPEEDTTLFVKNLNFETTDDNLRKHFESCGKIHYATVAIKKDKTDSSKRLSMGYGFVRFMYKNSADKALKELQGSNLDGKGLELKRSERTLANEVTATRKVNKKTKQTGSKILVRNVPFQATKKEMFELFKVFGEIKALRLPMKMAVGANTHRGFAFVDYFTQSEAKKAFEALSQSTHLYGRRLVLEWASTDDGVEEIRKRTADHFHAEEAPQSKKSVFNIDDK